MYRCATCTACCVLTLGTMTAILNHCCCKHKTSKCEWYTNLSSPHSCAHIASWQSNLSCYAPLMQTLHSTAKDQDMQHCGQVLQNYCSQSVPGRTVCELATCDGCQSSPSSPNLTVIVVPKPVIFFLFFANGAMRKAHRGTLSLTNVYAVTVLN